MPCIGALIVKMKYQSSLQLIFCKARSHFSQYKITIFRKGLGMIQLGTHNIKSSYITRDAWGTLQSSNILQGKKRRKFLQFHRAANGNEMKGTLAAYSFLMVDPILKYLTIRSLWTKDHILNVEANPGELMPVHLFTKRKKSYF